MIRPGAPQDPHGMLHRRHRGVSCFAAAEFLMQRSKSGLALYAAGTYASAFGFSVRFEQHQLKLFKKPQPFFGQTSV
jgi:hypothetical protein